MRRATTAPLAAPPEPLSFSAFIERVLRPSQLAELHSAMGWRALTDAQRVGFFEEREDGEPAAAPAMLELSARPEVWRSHYRFTSKLLTLPEIEDSITRVQRWEGFMVDPQMAWRSGYINASRYYQQPYILGYMGKRSVVYVPPTGPTGGAVATAVATALDTLTDVATLSATAIATATDSATAPDAVPIDPSDPDGGTASATSDDTDTSDSSDTATATASATASATAAGGPGADDTSDDSSTAGDTASNTASATAIDTSTDTDGGGTDDLVVPPPDETVNIAADTGIAEIVYRSSPPICLLQLDSAGRCLPVSGDEGVGRGPNLTAAARLRGTPAHVVGAPAPPAAQNRTWAVNATRRVGGALPPPPRLPRRTPLPLGGRGGSTPAAAGWAAVEAPCDDNATSRGASDVRSPSGS